MYIHINTNYIGLLFRVLPFLLLYLLVSIFSINNLKGQTYEYIKHHVDQIAYYDCHISFNETPGFIVGIIHQDSSYILPYGELEQGSSEYITDSTLFELGGASKVITALLCESLQQENIIHFDDPLSNYFENPTNQQDDPSIQMLLSHQGGYPRLPSNFSAKELDASNPYEYYTKKDLWKYYASLQILYPLMEYEYSNTAYALLELALEQKMKQPFPYILNEKLVQKYGLKDTVIQPRPSQSIAPAYNSFGQNVNHWNSPAFNAAVGIKSSLRDLMKLLRLQVQTNTFDNTHLKKTVTHIDKNSYAALGWHIMTNKKKSDLVLHSGATEGHTVFIGFIKETQSAVVILSNSKNGTNELGYLLLQSLNSSFKKGKKRKNLK